MNNDLEVIITKDGSKTILNKTLNEPYHSINGALNESQHVFIHYGLEEKSKESDHIRILEVGFGTGLNAILTFGFVQREKINVEYHSLETHPLPDNLIRELEYVQLLEPSSKEVFERIHQTEWNRLFQIDQHFNITKIHDSILTHPLPEDHYDLIYFDAFAPEKQPELWDLDLLHKFYNCLNRNGFLVTYCAKGAFKRNLKAAGFMVESLPGPAGKREMTRAIKK